MRFRTFLAHLSLLPLSACTRSCVQEYDNNEAFAQAQRPTYTETGANTLSCQLGSQAWTVLGACESKGGLGNSWDPNRLMIDGNTVLTYVTASGRMSGVRDSKPFYDMGISLVFRPTDTLGGLRLLGADTARTYTGRFVEQMTATNFLNYDDYSSRNRNPVRLLIRKLDRRQRIVSGTFTGMLYGGASRHDSLAVTDGRFDFRY